MPENEIPKIEVTQEMLDSGIDAIGATTTDDDLETALTLAYRVLAEKAKLASCSKAFQTASTKF